MLKKILMLSLSFTFILITGTMPVFSAVPAKESDTADAIRAKVTPQPSPYPLKTRADDARIEVDKSAKNLKLFINGELKHQYPIAIGKPSTPTPSGTYKVIEKAVKPDWWSPEGKIIKGSDPNNPIAERWMRLGKIQNNGTIKRTGIGIHGTIVPSSIGTAASGGCIRMYKKDVIELYPQVPIGTIVTIK